MTELNLWLDSYDDVYSDFDSRHYLKRRISDDFLHELRIEIKDREHVARDLVLLLPPERRDETAEKIIAASLVNFFAGQFRFHEDKCRVKLNKGILLLASGIITMLVNSWVNYRYEVSFPVTALRVLMEPAGWFLLWAALDFLFYDFPGLKRERDFFRELWDMHIHFRSA